MHRAPPTAVEGGKKPRGTIGQYFATMHCPVCEQLTVEGVCVQCRKDPAKVATTLSVRMKEAETKCSDIESVSFMVKLSSPHPQIAPIIINIYRWIRHQYTLLQ